MLSIVIPTLDAAAVLQRTLAILAAAEGDHDIAAAGGREIIIADGGSRDDTLAIARQAGARVVSCEPGRGRQLHAGACAARGDWLLFLHADTHPAPGWITAVARFMEAPANGLRAAAFRFALDDDGALARLLTRAVAWRCRLFALPFGDQGLLMARAFYDQIGGFRPMPLMEDVDMVRRIGRRRLCLLDTVAVTSAERYRHDGWLLRPLRNLCCLGLYAAGVPPRLIERLYR